MIGLAFLIFGNAVCYMTLNFTLVSATITDTTVGWDILGSPDVYVKMTVGGRTNKWPTKDNTFHPTWNTSFTWSGLADADIERIFFEFFDEDTFFDETIGSIYLDFTRYKSPSEQPKVYSMSSTFDYVTFYGDVLLTYPSGDECGGKTCGTCSTEKACNSVAMDGQCWWHSEGCYNRSNLCSGVKCDSCNTSGACASDPDVTGQCAWDSSRNTCYNLTTQAGRNADHASTNPNHASTNADHASTNADHASTNADHASTNADHASTNADHAATNTDHTSTNADHASTKKDFIIRDQQERSNAANQKQTNAEVIMNNNSVTPGFLTKEENV